MVANTISSILGGLSTLAWTASFYPQVLLNAKRRSVTGLSLDFIWLNPVGFAAYSASNAALFWSIVVRRQYGERHGGNYPQVRWNDLAFAFHALAISTLTLGQSFIYKRDVGQRASTYTRIFIPVAVGVVGVASLFAARSPTPRIEWLDVVYLLSYIKLLISFVKYLPQALLNFQRKSTVGWSIENILLDLTGGMLSLAQLVLDSWLADDWSGITGNPGKLGLSLLSMGFDLVFIIQHYVLYGGGMSLLDASAAEEEAASASVDERRPLIPAEAV